MNRFLQYHILTPHPVSNPNRSDDGSPKVAFVGGTWRGRKSSQNIKRSIRTSAEMNALVEHMGKRTLLLGDTLFEHLVANKIEAKAAEDAARQIIKVLANKKEKPEAGVAPKKAPARGKGKKTEAEAAPLAVAAVATSAEVPAETGDLKTDQLVFLSPAEIEKLKSAALELAQSGTLPKLTDLLHKTDQAIDIGMFGRMLAGSPEYNRVAAVQVSHAITTHKAAVEDDYFTAMDDLNDAREAAHIGSRGFISGIFYTYVVVDTHLLVSNLGGGPGAPEAAQKQGKGLASQTIAAFTRAIVSSASPGMQASYASRTRAEYVMIESGDDQPFTGAIAFDTAVTNAPGGHDGADETVTGLLPRSIKRLRDARARAKTRHELDYEMFEFSPDNDETLSKLVAFATKEIK